MNHHFQGGTKPGTISKQRIEVKDRFTLDISANNASPRRNLGGDPAQLDRLACTVVGSRHNRRCGISRKLHKSEFKYNAIALAD